MQIVQNDVNCCKCESPAKGLVLKIERYAQRLTQGYNALDSFKPRKNILVLVSIGDWKSEYLEMRRTYAQ